jgi:hypothetical protein
MNSIQFFLFLLMNGFFFSSTVCLLKIESKNKIKLHLTRSQLIPPTIPDGSIGAYCFVSVNGIVYDLNPLNDPAEDYTLNTIVGKDTLYFNFCKFANTQCKKDKSYVVMAADTPVNNKTMNCSLLSGTSRNNVPMWTILSTFSI